MYPNRHIFNRAVHYIRTPCTLDRRPYGVTVTIIRGRFWQHAVPRHRIPEKNISSSCMGRASGKEGRKSPGIRKVTTGYDWI